MSETLSTPVEVLRAARELILDPEHWTTGFYARNSDGVPVDPNDLEACKWCSSGALHQVVLENKVIRSAAYRYVQEASRELYNFGPIRVNDWLGHAAIIKVYDRAIELAEAAESQAAA